MSAGSSIGLASRGIDREYLVRANLICSREARSTILKKTYRLSDRCAGRSTCFRPTKPSTRKPRVAGGSWVYDPKGGPGGYSASRNNSGGLSGGVRGHGDGFDPLAGSQSDDDREDVAVGARNPFGILERIRLPRLGACGRCLCRQLVRTLNGKQNSRLHRRIRREGYGVRP